MRRNDGVNRCEVTVDFADYIGCEVLTKDPSKIFSLTHKRCINPHVVSQTLCNNPWEITEDRAPVTASEQRCIKSCIIAENRRSTNVDVARFMTDGNFR